MKKAKSKGTACTQQSPWEIEMMEMMKAKKAAVKSPPVAKGGGGNQKARKAASGSGTSLQHPPLRGHVVDDRGVDQDEFQRDMELAARRQNTKLYNRLITKYAKLHAADKSQLLFDQAAGAGGCDLNDFTWGCLINAYSRCGDADKAQKVLRAYLRQEDANEGNAVLYTSVIKALSNDGRLAEAVAWLRKLEAAAGDEGDGTLETQRAYGAVLRGCVRSGESQLALRLFGQLQKRLSRTGGSPESSSLQSLRQACALDPCPSVLARALDLLEDLPAQLRGLCQRGLSGWRGSLM